MPSIRRIVVVCVLATFVCTGLSGVALAAATATPALGTMFIADYGNNRIIEVAPGGTQTTLVSDVPNPSAATVDGEGDVFYSDASDNDVTEIPADGATPFTVGTGLEAPVDVAVDRAGDVFIVEQSADEVVEVPAGGGAQRTVGTGLANPISVAVDPAGDVYIAEDGNGVGGVPGGIVEVPAGGGPQVTVTTTISDPSGIAVGTAGDLYVSDPSDNLVEEFLPGGTSQSVGKGLESPTDLALDASGNLYLSDLGTYDSSSSTFTGGKVLEIAASDGAQSLVTSDVDEPVGLSAFAPAPSFTADSPTRTGYVGEAYPSYNFEASTLSGEPSPTFAVGTGALPPGLSLSSAGLLSGTPTAAGWYQFTVETDNDAAGSLSPTLTIAVPFATQPSPPQPGAVFVPDSQLNYVLELPPGGGTPIPLGVGLAGPTGAALDAAGNLYIADANDNEVFELPADGAAATTVGSNLISPTDVAVNNAGDVYIGQLGNEGDGSVVELPAGGGAQETVLSVESPRQMAVDAAGDLFVAYYTGVEELPAGSTTPVPIGTGLSQPYGVAVDAAGDVFIADTNNGRIVEEPANGSGQTVLVSGLLTPNGVGIDPDGDIFFSDSDAGTVTEDPAGGGPFTELNAGNWGTVASVTVYSPPPTFTADSPPSTATVGTAYAYEFKTTAPAGEPTPSLTVASGSLPPGLALDLSSGELSGTPTTAGTFSFSLKVANAATATITPTISIVVAASGAQELAVGALFESTLAGQVLELPGSGHPTTTVVKDPDQFPTGMAMNAAGDLYIANESTNEILEVTPKGDTSVVTTHVKGPTAVSVDAAGNVYVADTFDNRVIEITPRGVITTIGHGFSDPTGVAVDAAGNVFVSDYGNGNIDEVTAAGVQTVIDRNVNSPAGLAVNAAGDVFVADYGENEIDEEPAGGGAHIVVEKDVEAPTAVAVDASGNLYYTEASGLVEMAPTGVRHFRDDVHSYPIGVAVYAPPPAFTKKTPPDAGEVGKAYAGYTYAATAPSGEPAATFHVVSGSLPRGLTLNATTGALKGTLTEAGHFTFVVGAENDATVALGPGTTIEVVGSHTARRPANRREPRAPRIVDAFRC